MHGPRGEEWINPVSMEQETAIHAVLERHGVPVALNHYRRCYDIFRLQMGDNVVPLMDFTWHWQTG